MSNAVNGQHDYLMLLVLASAASVVIVLSIAFKLAMDAKGDLEEDRHSGIDGFAGRERPEGRGFEVVISSVSPPLSEDETPAKPGASSKQAS